LSDLPYHIEARKQVSHWECDTVIASNHKKAIVKMVERKSGFGVIVKVASAFERLINLNVRSKSCTVVVGQLFIRSAKGWKP